MTSHSKKGTKAAKQAAALAAQRAQLLRHLQSSGRQTRSVTAAFGRLNMVLGAVDGQQNLSGAPILSVADQAMGATAVQNLSSPTIPIVPVLPSAATRIPPVNAKAIPRDCRASETKSKSFRPPAKKENRDRHRWVHQAEIWKKHSPKFRLDVSLEHLRARPRSSKNDIEMARAKMATMQDWPADAKSALFYDRHGNLLVAYCAFLDEVGPDEGKIGSFEHKDYPGAAGRTLADCTKDKGVWMGLPTYLQDRYQVAAQELAGVLPPIFSVQDARHPRDEMTMEYHRNGIRKDTDSVDGSNATEVVWENRGVLHLVHAWAPQGWPAEKGLVASTDMRGRSSSDRHAAVSSFLSRTRGTAIYIDQFFTQAFYSYRQEFAAAYAAGVFNGRDPGPFLGRALVWKLQVDPHCDNGDDGPAVIFNLGDYTGGELYLPDLDLKLAYKPGSLVMLHASVIYHAVGEWSPNVAQPDQACTPGRVGNVFFFPKKSLDFLKDKTANWNRDTRSGKNLPEENESVAAST